MASYEAELVGVVAAAPGDRTNCGNRLGEQRAGNHVAREREGRLLLHLVGLHNLAVDRLGARHRLSGINHVGKGYRGRPSHALARVGGGVGHLDQNCARNPKYLQRARLGCGGVGD